MLHNCSFHNADVSDEQIRDLRERWNIACMTLWQVNDDELLENQEIFKKWFGFVLDKYMEEKRCYHTVKHLIEMFCFLDILIEVQPYKLNCSAEKHATLVMATFFHDVIYDPLSSTNEEDSAEYFKKFILAVEKVNNDDILKGPRNSPSSLETIVKYIIATKQHTIPNSLSQDYFLKIFLDIDMSVLAKEWKAYVGYASLIRQEYIHVNHEIYCEKRAEILTNFLSAGSIFHSDDMKKEFELRASENLRQEINMLKTGEIPSNNHL